MPEGKIFHLADYAGPDLAAQNITTPKLDVLPLIKKPMYIKGIPEPKTPSDLTSEVLDRIIENFRVG